MIVIKSKPRWNYVSPYTVYRKIMFWKDFSGDGISLNKIRNTNEWFLDNICYPISDILTKILQLRPRIDYVKVHSYDVWNANVTLAHIILPVLKEFVNNKDSYFIPDEEDSLIKDEHLRYKNVMAKMIFSFENLVNDEWDDFHDDDVRPIIENGFRLFGKYYLHLWT